MARPPEIDIPERHKPGKGAFNIRPKKVEQWLEDLPRANLGETARQIYDVLQEVNRTRHAYQERMRFLETLRDPVQYVTDSLKKHFIGASYPLPVKNQKIAAAAREIQAAMATGYKIAISDMLEKSFLFTDKKLLATLLHRAITYCGRTLLTSYQIYAPCAPGVWLELHRLYHIAEARKLENQPVADYQRTYVERASINAEYSRILLLALASPYKLRQGEANKIYLTLERWTQHCQLSPIDDYKDREHGYFAVMLDRDAPPRSLAMTLPEDCDPQLCRLLNTEPLAEVLRTEIQGTEEVGESTITSVELARPDLSHDLLRRLLIAWGVETKRNFSRTRQKEKVEVSIGLSAIHKHINARKNNGQQDIYNNAAHFESMVIENINEEKPDIWNMVYPSDLPGLRPLVEEEINLGHAQDNDNPASPTYPQGTWAIINESAGGYCLEYRKGNSARAQVGELIGIRRENDGLWKWGIGVIRWMKFSSTRTLRLGIEMLNPDAAAVGIRSLASGNDKNAYQRTLMLPEIPAIQQPATLITPPAPWRVGNQIMVNILGKILHVQLTAVSQCTGLFSQFQFKPLHTEQHDEDAHDVSGHWEVDKDFEKIWSAM